MRFAILASLVFHLLLLWPAPPRVPSKESAAPLRATIRPVSARAPALPVTSVSSPSATLAVPQRPISPPTAREPLLPAVAQRTLDLPDPVPVPQSTAPAASPVAQQASAPAPPAAAAVTGSPSGSPLSQADAAGDALDGLRGYRLAVASQARRFKRYPPQAMASGWTGSTEVRLEVGSDGRARAAMVQRTSGHEALDRAALAMIDAGAQRAHLPESLRGRDFAVVLPVVFNLEGE